MVGSRDAIFVMRFVAATLLLMLLSGCSDGRPSRVLVSGQVLIDGKPLTYGTIQFMPPAARSSYGNLDREGRFTLTCFDQNDGAVPAQHTIVIVAGESISSTETLWHAPKKYADYRTSGLRQEISGPVDDLVIHLRWEGEQPFVEDENGNVKPYRPRVHKRGQ